MARKQGSSLDLNWYEALKLRFQNGAAAPSGGAGAGRVYFDTVGGDLMVGDGANYRALAWADEMAGSYTDENAQDAVGAMLVDSSEIDFTYTDATPALTAVLKANSVALARLVNATAQYRMIGRISSGAGAWEEMTPANVRTALGTLDADTLNGQSASALTTAITAAIVGTAPGTLDTLGELSDALADDAAFSTTVTTALSNRVQAYSTNIGDGSTTAIVVTHNLNTRDIVVSVRDAGSPYDGLDVEWQATTVNTATLTFAVAPTSAQYRATIHAKP